MPLYEYRCESCGKVNEILQKFTDPAPDACETCGKGPLTKLMSQTSFVLKGAGWYVTDFRDNKKKPSESSNAASTDPKVGASADKSAGGEVKPTASLPSTPASTETPSPKKTSDS